MPASTVPRKLFITFMWGSKLNLILTMPDKGIQIVLSLLEKRESFLITKDSNTQLVTELLRAERLGYVQKEEKTSLYTLSEKGRKWIYSGFYQDEADSIAAEPVPEPRNEQAPLRLVPSHDIRENGRLPLIHAAGLLLGLLFLILALVKWLWGFGA